MRWILSRFRIDCQQEVSNYFSIRIVADRSVLHALMKELLFGRTAFALPPSLQIKNSAPLSGSFPLGGNFLGLKGAFAGGEGFSILFWWFWVVFGVSCWSDSRFRSWMHLFFGENGRRLEVSPFSDGGFEPNQRFRTRFASLDCWFFIFKQIEFPN